MNKKVGLFFAKREKKKKKKTMNTLEDIQILLDSPNYSEIVPNLFIGSFESVKDPSFIHSMDAVVSLVRSKNVPLSYFDGILKPKTDHMYIDIRDRSTSQISNHFISTYQFIAHHLRLGHRVLVHCMMGRSRSVTIVAHYLMKEKDWDAYRALKVIKGKRCVIRPNRGFIQQLISF